MNRFKPHMLSMLATFCLLFPYLAEALSFQVTRIDDPLPDGCDAFDCSLREAVLAANSNLGLDVINLNVFEYKLTRTGIDNVALVGDLDITDDLSIVGEFVSLQPLVISEISAHNSEDRIFDVATGVQFSIESLALKSADIGSQNGGAIKALDAELNLLNTHIHTNRAINGAGIYAEDSKLNIVSSKLIANFASNFGGAILLLRSQLTLVDSFINDNQAEYGGGVSINQFEDINSQASIQLSDSHLSGNSAGTYGGGLYLAAGVPLQANNTQRIDLINMQILNNEAAKGGGIFHHSGDLTIATSTLSENVAFTASAIEHALGAGIYFGQNESLVSTLTINHSLFYVNESISTQTLGKAAGLYIENHNAEIYNSTFSQNVADSYAAIEIDSGNLDLIHTTIAHNESLNGFDLRFAAGTLTQLQNNIIVDKCLFSGFTVVNSLDGNIESPGDTCGLGSGDLYGTNRRTLISADLNDNGGPTATHAINYYNSQAIGFAVPLNDLNIDQRLLPRDSQPDSGAYEVQPGEIDLIFIGDFE